MFIYFSLRGSATVCIVAGTKGSSCDVFGTVQHFDVTKFTLIGDHGEVAEMPEHFG